MRKGLIFTGISGLGKTHIATAICNELISKQIPVIFSTLTDIADKYKKSYKNSTENQLTSLLTKVDLLVIDSLGMETMNEWLLSRLFVIIDARMRFVWKQKEIGYYYNSLNFF